MKKAVFGWNFGSGWTIAPAFTMLLSLFVSFHWFYFIAATEYLKDVEEEKSETEKETEKQEVLKTEKQSKDNKSFENKAEENEGDKKEAASAW